MSSSRADSIKIWQPSRCLIPRGSASVRHVPSERRSIGRHASIYRKPGRAGTVLYLAPGQEPFRRFQSRNVPALISIMIRSNESKVPRCAHRLTPQTEQIMLPIRYLALDSWPLPCQQVQCQKCGPPNMGNFVAFSRRLHHPARASQDLVFRPRFGCQNYSLPHDSLGYQGYGVKINLRTTKEFVMALDAKK